MDAPFLLSGYASGRHGTLGEDQQDTANEQVDVEAEEENQTKKLRASWTISVTGPTTRRVDYFCIVSLPCDKKSRGRETIQK